MTIPGSTGRGGALVGSTLLKVVQDIDARARAQRALEQIRGAIPKRQRNLADMMWLGAASSSQRAA
jgi:hypothetical protein